MDNNLITLKTNTALLVDYLEVTIADEFILNSFVRDLEVVEITKTGVVIAFSSVQAKQLIVEEYMASLAQAVGEVVAPNLSVECIVKGESYKSGASRKQAKSEKVSAKHTFDNYVASSFNNEPIAIAKRTVKTPGKYSPFYINARSGLGKSHLLHAIGNKFLEEGLSVIYIEPNNFTKIDFKSICKRRKWSSKLHWPR